MTANGVPTSLVEKLLDNLKDLTKNVAESNVKQNLLQDSMDQTSDKIAGALTKVAERLNSPPRHEELENHIKGLDTKLIDLTKIEAVQADLLKSVIKTIKIAASLFGLAILISAILISVVEKTRFSTVEKQVFENQQSMIERLQKDIYEHQKKTDPILEDIQKALQKHDHTPTK
jgi:peptidoglycan hydrolase CwlO-like protein